MMTRQDYSYVAGFFDGEGCIGLYRQKGRNGPVLSVNLYQNHGYESDLLMEQIHLKWGGTLHQARDGKGYLYRAHALQAYRFLRDIGPRLRIKKRQAEIAQEWFEKRPGRTQGVAYPIEYMFEDTQTIQQLADLKK